MPISDLHGLPAIADEIYRLQPKTVLDLGVGFGLYGVVCRQVLDAMHGRIKKKTWTATIHGWEVYELYRNRVWKVYDGVVVADFTRVNEHSGYDLVLMIDSLEHLEPATGAAFLDHLVANNRHVIVSVPVEYCPQGATFGNPYEEHKTHYKGLEFERHNPVILHRGLCQVMSIKGAL